jgi:hypothetical protein
MTHNVATWDGALRALAGAAMLAGAIVTPFSLAVRLLAFGAMGLYLLATALAGSCLGYTLMGKSTACPLHPRDGAT